MTISKYISKSHKSASRSLGYALISADSQGWDMFTAVMLLRLDDSERVSLAYAALQALHPDHVHPTIDAACPPLGAGMPVAPLFNYMDEASHWADLSEPRELEAYTFAAFNRMAPDRQSAFLEFVQQDRRAAA